MFLELNAKMMLFFLREALCHQIVTYTNFAFEDEVHVRHLIFLIQNQSILKLNIKLRWFESKAHLK